MNLDMQKLEPLLGKMVNEIGAASNAALVIIGDKLGLFRSLATGSAMNSVELAGVTGTHERYVCEWLAAQAASGFIEYDTATQKFSMTPEQAAVLADGESPVNMIGGFQMLSATYAGEPKLAETFKTGQGVGWGEHCNCLFCGVERFFRSGYKAHLIGEWLPALDGIVDKLNIGARVADVGCGHGASTTLMGGYVSALALRRHRFPRAVDRACARARQRARQPRLPGRARAGFPGPLRPRHDLRRPARHGRPGRRGVAYPQAPRG